MKKFISGLIVGALLFSGVSVFADSINLVGQKVLVQGLFTIEKNGKKVDDAIVINSKAYAPVRSVSEAAGAKLTIEGKKIIMDDKTSAVVSTLPSVVPTTINELENEKVKITVLIAEHNSHIKLLEDTAIPVQEELLKNPQSDANKQAIQVQLDSYENLLELAKTELASLKQQLTDIDTQIAALK